jgi:hypothetical protein
MVGRALFALVCLVIAAGFALPLLPARVGTPGPAADLALPVGDPLVATCEDCPIMDERDDADCRADCPCAGLVQATFVAVEDDVSLRITVVIRPRSDRQALPTKLPAI